MEVIHGTRRRYVSSMAEGLTVSKAQSGYLILYPIGVLIVISSARTSDDLV